MRAGLVRYEKVTDELGNTIEIKVWQIPKTADKPHGYKYSLAYIVNGERIICYDNAEGKGDHRHIKKKVDSYEFVSLKKLTQNFFSNIEKFKKGVL